MTEPRDELLERYAEAVAQDPRQPSERVRNAARAHAQMLRDQTVQTKRVSDPTPTQSAANQSQWKLSWVASLAVVGLAGMLYVQIDRGAPEEREIAFGGPTPSQAPSPSSAPSPNPTTTMRTETAEAPPPEPTGRAAPAAQAPPRTQAKVLATAPPAPNQPAQNAVQATANVAAPRVYSAAPSEAEASLPAKAIGRTTEQIASADAERSARSEARAAPTARAVQVAPAAPVVAAAAAPPPPPTVDTQRLTQKPSGGAAGAQFLEAARMGDIATLQALQAQGVAVDTRDFSGNTALMLAVRHRHATVVRTLLDMGADASLRNKDGLTALRMADQMGFADITQLLNAGP